MATVTVSLEVALIISDMVPRPVLLNMEAKQAAIAFMEAVLAAKNPRHPAEDRAPPLEPPACTAAPQPIVDEFADMIEAIEPDPHGEMGR